jgi:hypothetical protein
VKSSHLRILPLLLAAAACDLPTSLPRWNTSWQLVAVEQDVRTAELLPEGVRVDPRGFVIDSFSVTSSIRLGDVCELCTCFDGPIPELEFSEHEWPVRLPSGMTEAQLLSGKARVVMTNRIGFDLLDDGLGGTGRLDVVLIDRNTDEVVDQVALTGSWPAGDSVAVEFELSNRRLHSGLVARVSGRTPGSGTCDVHLTEESGFVARVELRDVVASTVGVALRESALGLQPRSISLPASIAARLRPGEARIALDVELTSRVPIAAEVDLSVAPVADALFTGAAALHTPLLLPTATAAAPADAHGLYVLDLTGVPESKHLHFAARTRITGSRVVRLTGTESLRYRLIVRAEVPSR